MGDGGRAGVDAMTATTRIDLPLDFNTMDETGLPRGRSSTSGRLLLDRARRSRDRGLW